MPRILPYKGTVPRIAADAFVAPGATVIGDVEIGSESSIWFGCVVRGDVNVIRIGARSNLQDGTVVHVDSRRHGTHIGDDVLVAHMCVIHACTLEDRAYVGMGACVMDGAVVESEAMVGAGALVTPGKVVKSGELWTGRPAQPTRILDADERTAMLKTCRSYVDYAAQYRMELP